MAFLVECEPLTADLLEVPCSRAPATGPSYVHGALRTLRRTGRPRGDRGRRPAADLRPTAPGRARPGRRADRSRGAIGQRGSGDDEQFGRGPRPAVGPAPAGLPLDVDSLGDLPPRNNAFRRIGRTRRIRLRPDRAEPTRRSGQRGADRGSGAVHGSGRRRPGPDRTAAAGRSRSGRWTPRPRSPSRSCRPAAPPALPSWSTTSTASTPRSSSWGGSSGPPAFRCCGTCRTRRCGWPAAR